VLQHLSIVSFSHLGRQNARECSRLLFQLINALFRRSDFGVGCCSCTEFAQFSAGHVPSDLRSHSPFLFCELLPLSFPLVPNCCGNASSLHRKTRTRHAAGARRGLLQYASSRARSTRRGQLRIRRGVKATSIRCFLDQPDLEARFSTVHRFSDALFLRYRVKNAASNDLRWWSPQVSTTWRSYIFVCSNSTSEFSSSSVTSREAASALLAPDLPRVHALPLHEDLVEDSYLRGEQESCQAEPSRIAQKHRVKTRLWRTRFPQGRAK